MTPDNELKQDAWLESLLRDDAAGTPYLDDQGFTARLMDALPARRRTRNYDWIIAVMALLGILIGGIWLSGIEAFTRALLGLVDWRAISVDKVVMAVTPLAMYYWLVIRETLEHTDPD